MRIQPLRSRSLVALWSVLLVGRKGFGDVAEGAQSKPGALDGGAESVKSRHAASPNIITVTADGSGTIVDDGGGDDTRDSIVSVNADGSGSYNGPSGIIELDGKGGGTWNGERGIITVNPDGSGSWVSDEGTIEIGADGSGSWIGCPLDMVSNDGKGS